MNWYYVIAAVLFIVGIVVNTSINRRRFYRRGPGGLQHYDSYGKAVATTWLERLGKLVAVVLILFAIGFAGMGYQLQQRKNSVNNNNTEKRF
ncbi:hypothetical protein BFS30_24405 [Pedobacter steynii]|uniref:Molybdenum ABC transporter permease n=1 Tax=Pedobacter steynii TaxID=430522 RepID=A0A1D7QMY6_9SPHI|nr:hypothetical protein BFS30_24405 [Pedobacter steynii]